MYNKVKERAYHSPYTGKCIGCIYRCEECSRRQNRNPETHTENLALCWCCGHSTDGTCQYMMDGEPYEDSIYTQRTLKDGTINTNIRTCPNFERG